MTVAGVERGVRMVAKETPLQPGNKWDSQVWCVIYQETLSCCNSTIQL